MQGMDGGEACMGRNEKDGRDNEQARLMKGRGGGIDVEDESRNGLCKGWIEGKPGWDVDGMDEGSGMGGGNSLFPNSPANPCLLLFLHLPTSAV